MHTSLLSIILIQLFWCSLVTIGAAGLLLILRSTYKTLTRSQAWLKLLPIPMLLLVAAALGAVSVAVPIALAYLIHLSVGVMAMIYATAFIAAAAYVLQARQQLIGLVKQRLPRTKAAWLGLSLVTACLLCDYVLALHVKGLLVWDAGVHIARVNLIAHGHFNLSDPYFGNHGVVDPRYSTNLLLGLMAIAVRLLHSSAVTVWLYSYGFFRLLIWLSIFTLSWSFLNRRVRDRWAYVLLAAAPFLLSYYFFNAEFPDRIGLVWVVLLLVGLKLWLETESAWLVVVASLLIATTHSVISLMALGFITVLGLYLGATKVLRRHHLILLLSVASLLLLPVLLNLHYPNLIALSQQAFQAANISGSPFAIHQYGPLKFGAPLLASPRQLLVYGVVITGVLASARIRHKLLQATIFLLCAAVALTVYEPTYTSLIGYFVIIRSITNHKVQALVVLLIIYYGLLVYNPVLVALVNGRVPPWVIARFQEFNVLGLIASFIAWLALIEYPSLKWQGKRLTIALYMLTPLIYFFVIPFVYDNQLPGTAFPIEGKRAHAHDLQLTAALYQFIPELQYQVVYSDDDNTSFYIPAVVPQASVITTLDSNYSPMANIPLRDACGQALQFGLRLNDLAAAGVTRVVTNTYKNKTFIVLADSRSYLRLDKQFDGYRVYSVHGGPKTARQPSICSIPWRQ